MAVSDTPYGAVEAGEVRQASMRLPLLLTILLAVGLTAGAGFATIDLIAKASAGEGFVFPLFCH